MRGVIGRSYPASASGWSRPAPAATVPVAVDRPSSAYRSGVFEDQQTAAWWPSNPSADGAILPNRDLSLARVRDLIRNNATAGAAVERLKDLTVGHGLTLSAKPDAIALGITPEQAHDLARNLQAEWRLFAQDPRYFCDASRRVSMNGLFRQFAETMIVCNEATFVLTMRDDPAARYGTCVMPVDPDRLCNPLGKFDGPNLRGGIEMDAFGAPIAYHVRNAHPADWWAFGQGFSWTRVPRNTSWGRPVFVHAFEPQREGQTRAMTSWASVVVGLRMVTQYAENELASSALNALFGAFIESDLPPDEVAGQLTPAATVAGGRGRESYVNQIVDHYTNHPARLGGVRVPVLLPGTKMAMNDMQRQTTAFPSFEAAFLQKIASRIGISYEQLSMDWSRTNYSSARAALNEVWRTVQRMSAIFSEQIVQPIYFAFVEEAFARGFVKAPAGAPDFWDMPGAYLRARWIGPGRGWIDPVKEAEASALRLEGLISTLERECADQGMDMEETLDQIARENTMLAERGLTRMSIVAAVQADKGAKPDSEEATGPAGPGGAQEAA